VPFNPGIIVSLTLSNRFLIDHFQYGYLWMVSMPRFSDSTSGKPS